MTYTVSLPEILGFLLAACGGIITVSGAIGVIMAFIKRIKHPEEEQNRRLDELERIVAEMKNDRDNQNEEIKILKRNSKLTQESLWAICGQLLDGNNRDALKNVQTKLYSNIFETSEEKPENGN